MFPRRLYWSRFHRPALPRAVGRGREKAAGAIGVAPKLVGKIENVADKAVPLVRKELVEVEKPLVKEALEQGSARRVTDKALAAEGHTIEVVVESGGQRHLFRMNKNGKWCRFSSPICELDFGSEVAAAAKSPKSVTAGQLVDVRSQMKTIEDEAAFLQTTYQRIKPGDKVDLSLLSKEERALLDSLAEEGDAARHLRAAADEEARLVAQLYREGRPVYEIMRAVSPSYKSSAAVLP
jgi:hypothetical protein